MQFGTDLIPCVRDIPHIFLLDHPQSRFFLTYIHMGGKGNHPKQINQQTKHATTHHTSSRSRVYISS
jgi:hypothetical protein